MRKITYEFKGSSFVAVSQFVGRKKVWRSVAGVGNTTSWRRDDFCAHVSYDPFVESRMPESPEAGEGIIVVDAVLHVFA